MDNRLLYLIPLAMLLFSFRKKSSGATVTCIFPGKDPIYGGAYVVRVKPNTKVFSEPGGHIIAYKNCYVEVIKPMGQWLKVVNRTAYGESDFTGYINSSDVSFRVTSNAVNGVGKKQLNSIPLIF